MANVEAKQVQLIHRGDDGLFMTDETIEVANHTVLREQIIVTQAEIDESVANCGMTGLLYISTETP